MRSLRALIFAAAIVLFTGCATQPVRQAPFPVNIPEEVAAEFHRSVSQWNAGNLEGFLAMYAESATFTLADGYLIGRQAIREFYGPNFAPGARRDQLTMEQLEVEVLSPDVVLVRGIYRNTRDGEIARRGTTSLVMRRIYGRWQIIHDHSS